jgi:hypothetical protein
VNRTFGIHTPGSAPRACTCRPKGKGANARHNAGNTFLYDDDDRGLVERGTITKKRITSEIFVASDNSRGTSRAGPSRVPGARMKPRMLLVCALLLAARAAAAETAEMIASYLPAP